MASGLPSTPANGNNFARANGPGAVQSYPIVFRAKLLKHLTNMPCAHRLPLPVTRRLSTRLFRQQRARHVAIDAHVERTAARE